MRADYRQVDRLSQQLCERMRTRNALTVRDAGRHRLHARPSTTRCAWVKTSGIINPRYWSNLPAGEVFTTPASVDGTFVCDGTAGDYFNGKYGELAGARRWCSRSAAAGSSSARATHTACSGVLGATATPTRTAIASGELAFGTNLGLREMIGILLQDEKVPGVHLAFGDPYGSQTHADWKSKTHVDVLTRDCDVWIDDEQVIADGQYLLDRFEMSAAGR